MAKVERFEDLICWQKARELVNLVYDVTKAGQLAKDFELTGQLRAAAISTMNNIAEGFARFHKREFIRFLDISQSSAAELRSMMYIVLDQKYLPFASVKTVQDKSDKCRKTTLALLRHINQTLNPQSSTVQEPAPPYANVRENDFRDLPEEFISLKGPQPL